MFIHAIQGDVRHDRSPALNLAIAELRTVREEAARDSFVRVLRGGDKFIAREPVMLAQTRAAKVSSYQDVSERLKAIGRVSPGPLAQALRSLLIGKLVKEGAKVLPHLLKAMGHSDKVVRKMSAVVLGSIFRGTAKSNTWKGVVCRLIVMPKLKVALKDRDAGMRKAVKVALRKINRKTPSGPPKQFNPLDGLHSGSQP